MLHLYVSGTERGKTTADDTVNDGPPGYSEVSATDKGQATAAETADKGSPGC